MKSKLILMLFALFAWGNDNPFAPPQSIDENAILDDFEKKDVNDVKQVILRTIKKQKLLSIGIVVIVTGAILTALLPPLVLAKIVDTITGKREVSVPFILLYFILLAYIFNFF